MSELYHSHIAQQDSENCLDPQEQTAPCETR
jgi:hypothetical protein